MHEDCHECGTTAVLLTEVMPIMTVGGRMVTIPVTLYRCPGCGEEFFNGDMANDMTRDGAAAIRERDGLLRPEEIAAIRASLGLTPGEMDRMLDQEEGTVERWEGDMVPQPPEADVLIRALCVETESAVALHR
jgi:putative zinc finger/helix-turn-helix YgiT family protein